MASVRVVAASSVVLLIRTAYGLFSFPFLVFKIPVLANVLMHTRQMGYDEQGDTVRFAVKKRTNERAPHSLNRKTMNVFWINKRILVTSIQTCRATECASAFHRPSSPVNDWICWSVAIETR